MNKKIVFMILVSFTLFSLSTHHTSGHLPQKKRVKSLKMSTLQLYKFEVQGIKRIITTPTKVKFQVQYYISPTYPKPCFIGVYIPTKARTNPHFSFKPAGRLPNGVPKGQKHFTDNITVEVNYLGTEPFISRTMEVVIYDPEKNLKLQLIEWGQKWGSIPPPSDPDLIISAITVSKYNPHVKTTFTIHVKNQGGTACSATEVNVWLYKLLPDGSVPSTPNEYWSGTIPTGGGSIGPGQTKTWTHDKYEFMVEGNWRVKAKVNQYHNQTESNYNNNSFTYNFPIPN
jgi:hypothetical protein